MSENFFLDRVMNIAHRGGAGLSPENTLYAFRLATTEFGADALEMDVWSSKDGYLVVHHDKSVERTTGDPGEICDMTLAQIKSLDAGYNFTTDGKTFPMRGKGLTIPTLEEVFQAFPGVRMNIEIKQARPPIEKKLYDLIVKYNMAGLALVVARQEEVRKRFASLNRDRVATAASAKQIFLFLVLTRLRLNFLYTPNINAFQAPREMCGVKVLSRRFIREAHNKNIAVHSWIINNKKKMRQLVKAGMDGIITDYPDQCREVLNGFYRR